MTALTLSGVTKSYGGTTVLDGVDLHVPARGITAVLGPSGCGKTTMLRVVAGFARPDAGEVRLGDEVVHGPSRSVPAQRRRVGYVPQEGALFPHLDVAANIGFGLTRGERRASRRVDELLEMVGLDPSMRHRQPHELSGGQQQRVALARALAPRPAVVLLDEPFSSLDAALREGTGRAVVRALRDAGATAVLVTHDQGEALSLADEVAVMRAGRLVQTAAPQDLYRAPADAAVARSVGAAIVLPATVSAGHVTCVLGELPLDRTAPDGPVRVLLRPEQLRLSSPGANGSGQGVPATVTEVTFYGHDAAVHLDLGGAGAGVRLTARVLGGPTPAPGDHVAVTAVGSAQVLADDA
jgi:iron(III) transport system ATP-binding protein